MRRTPLCLGRLLVVAFALAGVARAQEDWDVTIEPYVWVPALEGEGSAGGSPEVDFEIDYPGELSAALPLALRVESPSGRSFTMDVLYARWTDDDGSIETESEISLVEAGAGVPLSEAWELAAGLRWIELGLDVEIGGADADADESWVDPWIGARGAVPIGGGWSVRGRADVGGFGVGSEFTWQALAVAAWGSARWRFDLGYRALSLRFDEDDLDTELLAHGPILGVAFTF